MMVHLKESLLNLKTRLLFYNGKQAITESSDRWWMWVDANNRTNKAFWPLVSPYQNWPQENVGLNLNFSNDTRYYIDPDPNYYDNQTPPQVIQPGYFDQGQTLFDDYWARYVSSLYDKFSRRLTAKFILNNVDLQYLTFDDVIFVNGKYYRPEKIIDAQVGAETEVTCQLISLNDQRPLWLDEPLTGFSVAVSNTNCIGEQGNIQITTNGSPAFTWELQNSGAQGNNNPTGTAPFTFTIDAPVGIDTLTVTDSLGRFATIQVDVPASTATQVTAPSTYVDPTICQDGVQTGWDRVLEVAPVAGDGFPTCGYFTFDTINLDTYNGWQQPGYNNGTYDITGDAVLNAGPVNARVSYEVELMLTSTPTVAWSQFQPGIAQSAGTTRVPTVIGSQYISGWPTTAP